MDPNNRITKDTSARKNTSQHGMHSAIEMAAVKAAHEAYLTTIISGYEQKLETIQADHEAETTKLKLVHDKEKSKWEEKLRGVATEAARKAFAASAAEISELKIKNTALQEQESARIVELKTQLNNLKNQDIPRVSELETDVNILRQENVDLEKQVALGAATKDVAVQSATRALNSTIQQQSSALAVYQTKVSTMETAHAKEIATLKKKLKVSPNSWTEIAVSGKGRKRRTYVRRQHARFTDALGEYAKDVGKDVYFMQFEHKGIRVGGNETKTFEQLNIKDGDELRMHGG